MTTCVCGAQVSPDNQFCPDCAREVHVPKELDFSSSSFPWLTAPTAAAVNVPEPYVTTDAVVSATTGPTETLATAAPASVGAPVSRPARVVTPPAARPALPAPAPPDVEPVDSGTVGESPPWNPAPRGRLASASSSPSSSTGTWTSSSTVPPANPYAGSTAEYGATSPGTIVNGRPGGGASSGLVGRLGIGLVAIVALLGKFGGALLGLGLFKWLLFIWAWGHGFGGLILLVVLVSIVGGLIVHGLGG